MCLPINCEHTPPSPSLQLVSLSFMLGIRMKRNCSDKNIKTNYFFFSWFNFLSSLTLPFLLFHTVLSHTSSLPHFHFPFFLGVTVRSYEGIVLQDQRTAIEEGGKRYYNSLYIRIHTYIHTYIKI